MLLVGAVGDVLCMIYLRLAVDDLWITDICDGGLWAIRSVSMQCIESFKLIREKLPKNNRYSL